MKYRKKPVVIEAVQWTGTNEKEIFQFLDAKEITNSVGLTFTGEIEIETLEGKMTGSLNDWIIRGVKGELYPCKPDIFEATYEAVGE